MPAANGIMSHTAIARIVLNGQSRLLSEHSFGHDGARRPGRNRFAYLNNQPANPIDGRADRLTTALRTALRLDTLHVPPDSRWHLERSVQHGLPAATVAGVPAAAVRTVRDRVR